MKITKARVMRKVKALSDSGNLIEVNEVNRNKTVITIDKISLTKESVDPKKEGLSLDNQVYSLQINGVDVEVFDGIQEIYTQLYYIYNKYEQADIPRIKVDSYLSI